MANASFLVRMSSKVWLYVDEATPLETFCEGIVYYWPLKLQEQGEPPLKLPLIPRTCQGAKARRMVIDECAGWRATDSPDGRPILSLEVGKRRTVQNVQTYHEESETRFPDSQAGTSRSGDLATGSANPLGSVHLADPCGS